MILSKTNAKDKILKLKIIYNLKPIKNNTVKSDTVDDKI